jgi:anthranilate synthase component 1
LYAFLFPIYGLIKHGRLFKLQKIVMAKFLAFITNDCIKKMQLTSFEAFRQSAMHGNVIPVAATLLADLLTPVSAFLRLCGEDESGFLLESVEGGEKIARYSFLGRKPVERMQYNGKYVEISKENAGERIETDIFTYLQERLKKLTFVPTTGLPRFSGGFVGYFGYDTVRLLEKIPVINPETTDVPLAQFELYDTVLAFDHFRQQIHIITNVILAEGVNLRKSYEKALEKIEETKAALQRPIKLDETNVKQTHANISSTFARNDFCQAVQTAKEYIRAGDIFQVVLSQEFSRPFAAPPFDVYRALRVVNPSPYLYFLRNDGRSIIGSSPELLVRVENGEATVRPIAGTRPRGKTPEEDARLAAELLADEKERAEHVMLVDLGRNDIGRISRYGEVRVTEKMMIERYSHVMHIVSEVRGKLRPGVGAIDALKACFPAGTVSGAPKVRAMEIIEELEPKRRGLYAGALGYIDFSGNLDTCITIRTLEVRNGVAYFQAGAGIVADSVPEKEYEETVHKSNAIRSAIILAEGGLDDFGKLILIIWFSLLNFYI